jgi:hypothetical protein
MDTLRLVCPPHTLHVRNYACVRKRRLHPKTLLTCMAQLPHAALLLLTPVPFKHTPPGIPSPHPTHEEYASVRKPHLSL